MLLRKFQCPWISSPAILLRIAFCCLVQLCRQMILFIDQPTLHVPSVTRQLDHYVTCVWL